MEVTLIGMGPGGAESLTAAAAEALGRADCLIGSRRLLEECALAPQAPRFPATKSADMLEILEGRDFSFPCVLYSGDTGFHSGARTLLPLLRERGVSVRVLPGVSSLQYFAAQLGRPWQEWSVVSAHGLTCDPVGEVIAARGRPVFFLTGGAGGTGALCQRLSQAGLGHLTATVGEDLSYPGERIRSGPVYELAGQVTAPLSVLLVEGYEPPTNAPRSQGLDDSVFLRGDVPMTKQEVRSAVLAKLEVRDGETYWDVGAGTGSVSVECALSCPAGRVFAVEKKEEALALLEENRERFHAANLSVVGGTAPEALKDLPAPDRVFIGGTSGELGEILDVIFDKNPAARVVCTAVTLETVAEAARLFAHLEGADMVQVSATRTRSAGRYHLMDAQNPVWIFSGEGRA